MMEKIMEWLLIAWVGTLSGGATMERLATEAECKQIAAALVDIARVKDTPEVIRWRCIEVAPLAK
jgi:hypothetical protein